MIHAVDYYVLYKLRKWKANGRFARNLVNVKPKVTNSIGNLN